MASHRVCRRGRLSIEADALYHEADAPHKQRTPAYRQKQKTLYRQAVELVKGEDN